MCCTLKPYFARCGPCVVKAIRSRSWRTRWSSFTLRSIIVMTNVFAWLFLYCEAKKKTFALPEDSRVLTTFSSYESSCFNAALSFSQPFSNQLQAGPTICALDVVFLMSHKTSPREIHNDMPPASDAFWDKPATTSKTYRCMRRVAVSCRRNHWRASKKASSKDISSPQDYRTTITCEIDTASLGLSRTYEPLFLL